MSKRKRDRDSNTGSRSVRSSLERQPHTELKGGRRVCRRYIASPRNHRNRKPGGRPYDHFFFPVQISLGIGTRIRIPPAMGQRYAVGNVPMATIRAVSARSIRLPDEGCASEYSAASQSDVLPATAFACFDAPQSIVRLPQATCRPSLRSID